MVSKQSHQLYKTAGRRLSTEELAELLGLTIEKFQEMVNRSETARHILIRSNMRLVLHIAKSYRYRGLTLVDLVHEGTIGMCTAIAKFDPDRGIRFSTYASHWIKQAIRRAVADKSRLIRLPVNIHEHIVSLRCIIKQYEANNLNRKPSIEELSKLAGLQPDKIENILKVTRGVYSSNENIYLDRGSKGGNNHVQINDRIPSINIDPGAYYESNEQFCKDIIASTSTLTTRDYTVLRRRYGVLGSRKMSLAEVGTEFRLSRERIRQIEYTALGKIRSTHLINKGVNREMDVTI